MGKGGILLDVDVEVVCCQDQSPRWKHACYGDGFVVGRLRWDTPAVLFFSFLFLMVLVHLLLLHLLYNTPLLVRLLPWFSALLLRLIPSPRA